MRSMAVKIFLVLLMPVFFCASLALANTERRTALVIGNSDYSSSPLKNPVNDALDVAANLKKLGFSVMLKTNAGHKAMEDAIRDFGDQLRKGGVGLFFYAGHGVQIGGRNYLLPVGANIQKETDVKFYAVDVEIVLAEMGNAGNNLNIVILDACRDNPFGKSFRSASRGLAIISEAPKGTFITYSTSPGRVAADGSGRNSPYTESMIRHMNKEGLQIEDVFKGVRKDLGRKTGGQQIPWELSSLEGEFYFKPGKSLQTAVKQENADLNDELQAERLKIAEEREKLHKEKEILEQKKALDEERRKIEEERRQLAITKRPSTAMGNETRKDGRFIAYDNGTVLDTKTNLMWAAKDNGSNINWQNAKSYCENYRGGGYADWRMPTQDELAGLSDRRKSRLVECNTSYPINFATELIDITCFAPWATETSGSGAIYFGFMNASKLWYSLFGGDTHRALPVRSAK
ncbi:MAG: caspase family protein [Syntrophaceae bacterium]|jgi:uncharacterized caspase-like protein|nr:caspase family protein [Syntrophaceae bacterium]